ncbi:hypothetical protein, partial [Escherichia coli]|uniref:hypothetical protein n=1 Tax=Escherichia coli TaxID=562 RepID=UPI001BDB7578
MADMRGHFPHYQHHASFYAGVFLCTENPQLGWGFRKAFSFEPVIKTPFDLLKHLAVWQLQVSNK